MKKKFSRSLLGIIMVLLIACKTKSETGVSEEVTILVQLYSPEAVDALVTEFENYQLQKKKVVSRPMHIFLFSFNSEIIKETELVEQLKTSKLVKEAQPNRNVYLRN